MGISQDRVSWLHEVLHLRETEIEKILRKTKKTRERERRERREKAERVCVLAVREERR